MRTIAVAAFVLAIPVFVGCRLASCPMSAIPLPASHVLEMVALPVNPTVATAAAAAGEPVRDPAACQDCREP